jgi:hypothetical protein
LNHGDRALEESGQFEGMGGHDAMGTEMANEGRIAAKKIQGISIEGCGIFDGGEKLTKKGSAGGGGGKSGAKAEGSAAGLVGKERCESGIGEGSKNGDSFRTGVEESGLG